MNHANKDISLKEAVHTIQGHSIRLRIPEDPESVLSNAVDAIERGPGASDPYWCLVWDAAPKTADLILQEEWPANLSALEIGCGVGLTGIAASHAGFDVTLSDYSPSAVQNALANAHDNGFHNIRGFVLDWKSPPNDVAYDFIIGSDILYERSNHSLVLQTCRTLVKSAGVCWIGDMGRAALPHFVEMARDDGWNVQIRDENGRTQNEVVTQQFQLLVLSR